MTFKVLLHHYGRFTSPPGRKFEGGLIACVDPVEFETFSADQLKFFLTNCLGYDENSPTFFIYKNQIVVLIQGQYHWLMQLKTAKVYQRTQNFNKTKCMCTFQELSYSNSQWPTHATLIIPRRVHMINLHVQKSYLTNLWLWVLCCLYCSVMIFIVHVQVTIRLFSLSMSMSM